MTATLLEPLGVEVAHSIMQDFDDGVVDWLVRLLAEHGVVVLRDQTVDDADFLAFLRRLGRPVFTVGETPVPGFPDLNVVSNVGRTTAPRSVFHVDTSYVSRPPAYTALRAVTVPEQGGQTLFSNQYRAYLTLPEDVRRRLADRTITHVVTGVDPGAEQEHSAQHPVFRPHPLSHRVALYLSSPARCVSISGLDAAESRRTIEFLYEHSIVPENLYRHDWRPGDVVVWDNGCVMHRADHSGVVGDRVLHRGMVDGYAAE